VAGEAVILATCHRVEVYAAFRPSQNPTDRLVDLIAGWSGLGREQLLAQAYVCRGEEVARHLFAVASGLDSMVLGETQVLGQVREALQHALACGAAGRILTALFRHAVAAGKRARRETQLGRPDASLSLAAIELAEGLLGTLRGKSALVIGAGKMGELAALALAEQGARPIHIVSRTTDKARCLAARLGGTGSGFAGLEDALVQCHLAISCTSAPHPVVQQSLVARAMARRSRSLLLFDLAMPRDIEPGVGAIKGVALYNVDSLRGPAHEPDAAVERETLRAREIGRAHV
jgi:glutamyl-tRNA reductase